MDSGGHYRWDHVESYAPQLTLYPPRSMPACRAMAVVPLLLWIHHVETMPPADLHESVSTDEPARLLRDATEKGVTTTDTLEEWAA